MLIFDSFPDQASATAFANRVQDSFARSSQIFESQDASDAVDPFPFELRPPIVLVERDDVGGQMFEMAIESLVKEFDGVFAGT